MPYSTLLHPQYPTASLQPYSSVSKPYIPYSPPPNPEHPTALLQTPNTLQPSSKPPIPYSPQPYSCVSKPLIPYSSQMMSTHGWSGQGAGGYVGPRLTCT